jgi:hypothetical protein
MHPDRSAPKRARTALAAAFASLLFAGDAFARRFDVQTISNNADTVSEFRARVVGDVVVWQAGSGAFSEIMFWNDTGFAVNLSSNGVADENPETDGIHVVWQQGPVGARNIAVYDILTGLTAVLPTPLVDEAISVVSGVTLAWVGMVDADGEVFIDPGPIGNQLTGNSLVESSLQLDGENLIFVQGDDLGLTPGTSDDLHDIGLWNGELGEFYILGLPGNDDLNPSIAGDTIVWQVGEDGSGGIWRADTDATQGVLFDGGDDRNPHTDGRIVVWDHFDGVDRDIYRIDLASPGVVSFVTTDNAADDVTPRVSGNDIVWVRESVPGDSEIWVSLDGEPPQAIAPTVGNGRDDVRPQLGDTYVVWESCVNLGQPSELCDIVVAPEPGATLVGGAMLAVLAALAVRNANRARVLAKERPRR